MTNYKKIAVIGAGPVGLVALKSFLEQGHDVTAYEQQSSIGGLWNYQEDDSDGHYVSLPTDPRRYLSGCYYSLIQNTSKLMTQFSDFPVPASMPTILRHFEYFRYLQDYAKHFNLNEHIKLGATVTDLQHAATSAASARNIRRWEVHYESEGRNKIDTYDLVIVASGKFTHPSMPVYTGLDSFKSTVLHSVQVRRDDVFKNKRVLIVGGGFSGAEMIRNALNGHAQSICWTVSGSLQNTDHNHWVFSRFPDESRPNKPWDHSITRHGHPQKVFGENGKLSTWLYPLNQCEMHPNPKIPGDGLAITDLPLIKKGMQSGQVRLVAPIDHFSDNSVVLSDNAKLDDVDLVVFCTGYTKAFPFLDDLWNKKDQVEAALYRHMLPTEDQLQGLAFLGLTSKISSLFPVAEMQSRWLAEFWASRCIESDGSVYSQQELKEFEADIQRRKESLVHREKFNFLLDSMGYMENLAIDLGCRPPVEKLIQSDKELGVALMYGPLVSTQYRLVGKHAWPEAREYIIETAKEVCGDEWQGLMEHTALYNFCNELFLGRNATDYHVVAGAC